jgi:sporulation-control protein spo0M
MEVMVEEEIIIMVTGQFQEHLMEVRLFQILSDQELEVYLELTRGGEAEVL